MKGLVMPKKYLPCYANREMLENPAGVWVYIEEYERLEKENKKLHEMLSHALPVPNVDEWGDEFWMVQRG
jgi:hypothetical protein